MNPNARIIRRLALRVRPDRVAPPEDDLPAAADLPVAVAHAEEDPASRTGPMDSDGRWRVMAECASCHRVQVVDLRAETCPACGFSGFRDRNGRLLTYPYGADSDEDADGWMVNFTGGSVLRVELASKAPRLWLR